ncbi:MAG: OadG family transporter subunit [Campylobacterota bacterium]|nr:OadG family transporter subunit [Campylobacterota bacterium]
MEEVNLVSESLKFMALGMGIVFIFLITMIFALKAQAKLIAKFFPEKPKEDSSQWKPEVVQNDEKDTVAAITAAIIHYNNQKGQ